MSTGVGICIGPPAVFIDLYLRLDTVTYFAILGLVAVIMLSSVIGFYWIFAKKTKQRGK